MDRSSLSRREYITQPLRGLGTAFASRGSPASVPEEKARVPTSHVPLENGDLRLVPASQARPPAPYVPAILFVIRAELLAQRRLFIQDDKQMHAEGNGCHRRDHSRVSMSENDPQPDSSRLRSRRTSGYARIGRSPPLPIAEVERKAQAFRVPSTRSPKCIVEQPRIPAPMESPPAIANAPSPPFLRGSRATPARARTIGRRTPRPLPAQPPRSSIFPGARVLRAPALEHR